MLQARRIAIHQSDRISVWCYPERGIIHHEMHGLCYRDSFRLALEAGVQAMRTFGASGWLSDDRANGALSPADEAWGEEVWFPTAQAGGWRHWAMLEPRAAVGQLNASRIVKRYAELGVTTGLFAEVSTALGWLEALHRRGPGMARPHGT